MSESIRCPSCRGAKRVPKLGGMIGDCNTCIGKGTILAVDKPKPAVVVDNSSADSAVIAAVSNAVDDSPFTGGFIIDPSGAKTILGKKSQSSKPEPIKEEVLKIDPKKAVYKRKKA